MGQSGGKAPEVIHPGEAAQAAMGTAAAGEQMSIANAPIEQYANLYANTRLGPAEMRTQQALANQAAMQSASAQQAVQATVDPLAYAQRQMRLKAATDRLGQLTGQPASAFGYSDPRAFQTADMTQIDPLGTLARAGQNFAGALSIGSVNKAGANPMLISPNLASTYL